MPEETQRRLAAIVVADVVGYSRLMGADEVGTLAALRSHRFELIDPLIDKHGGRIVKTTGDGLLLEFPSVIAAVQCAIATQEGKDERKEKKSVNGRMKRKYNNLKKLMRQTRDKVLGGVIKNIGSTIGTKKQSRTSWLAMIMEGQ